jgi:glycosyltransferase involved in cell wall biosynthesis
MLKLPMLTAIIPIYNEAENLPSLLISLQEQIYKYDLKIIFVNDGSTDNSKSLLNEVNNTNIVCVNHSRNRGYGAAIKTGIKAAKTQYCVTIDGDGQHDLDDINKLFMAIEMENADLVVGNRKGKGSSRFRNLGKWIIKKITSFFIKIDVEDLNSGMKLYRTEVAKSLLKWAPNDMAFSETIVLLYSHFRYKITEVEINIYQRETGESTINYKTAIRTVKEILFLIINFFPFRFFGLLGGLLMISGFLWSVPFMINGEGLTNGAGFLLCFGLLVLLQGIILQTLTRFKFEGYEHIN